MLGGECSACCGGACSECAPSHVSITIASNNFLRHSEWRSMYGQTYKDSWGIIASPLSGTFRLSLARCSTPFGFPNAYEFVYESDEISYPGSGKIVAKFFNEPGVVARHLFTIEVPVTVCRGLNYKSYDPNNYKFYSLTEMLTPQYESFGGSTRVSVSAGVGKTSTTFVCSGQASSSRSYVAVGGVNAYDGQANDAAEGASPPCVVWSFDPTSTDAITAPNAQGYGYLRHYQPNMYGWTELSRSDVTTGQNAVTVSSVDFDCNSLQKGACCEGTTCSVKPQCQCVCQSGSCCGPDTYTNITNETGPRCRTESQAACAARGGTWRCGVPCRGLASDPAAGYGLGSEICSSLDATPSVSPVFKGVGTTCSPNPCCCPNVATVSVTISNFESYYEFPRLSPNGTWTLSHDSGTCDSWSYLQTLQSYSCPDASTVGGPANPLLSIGISSQGLGLIAADCTQIQATVSDSSFMSKVCSGTSFSGTTESVTSFGRVIYRFSYAVGNPLP